MTTASLRALPLLLAAAFFSVGARAAEPDAKRAEAKQHYESGLAHFNLQEYKEAIPEFEAAYRLRPDPVLLYNLAQACRLSNEHERALTFYRAYLRSSPRAHNRAEVAGRIHDLEKLVDDQKTMATSPPDHALTPEKPAPATETATTTTPTEPAAAATQAVTSPPTTSDAPTPVYKKWWLWTIVGVVVVGAAVGVTIAVTSSSKAATFNAGLGTVGPGATSVGPGALIRF